MFFGLDRFLEIVALPAVVHNYEKESRIQVRGVDWHAIFTKIKIAEEMFLPRNARRRI